MYPFWKSSSNPQQASSSSRSLGTKVPTQAREVNDSLFELHKPPGTPQMQVLFFNGLQLEDSSDLQFLTWRCGDGSCWPQTWLVEKFPGAHVLSVSYNGSIRKDSLGALDMHLVGENLRSDLLQADIGQMLNCPIILVGHSFGGLVIKQLYCDAHDKLHSSREGFEKAKLEKFLGNIRGIFYYATPHHGSKLVEKWVEKMAKTQANPLLKYFQTLSTEAARLNAKFDEIRGKYGKMGVFGLAEGLKTKLRDFENDMLVSEASARDGPSLYTVSEADHFSICQPENETSASFLKLKIFIGNISSDAKVEANNRKEAKAREDNRFDNHEYLPESIVGIEVPVQAVIAKLDKAARVGIVGMGGLGKTTLAKALFNKLGAEFERFEYSCFVLEVKKIEGNMRDVKDKVWKLMHRQGKEVGKEEGWSSLKGKRLFLVLDDISTDRDLTVLSSIVQDTSPESRFIVTSRDHQLLEKLDDVFNVSFLDKSTARQLFVSHAFAKHEEPLELHSYVEKIVRRCGGLPLSLEVVGKSLYRRGYQEDWEQTEHALANADGDSSLLNERLWANLRVSYDRLTDKEQKIFLDVTTYFSGNRIWTLQEAKAAWRVAHDTKTARLLWQTLVNLSLVYNVAEDETIKVHEQLESLGRRIASEQRQDLEGIGGLQSLQETNGLDEKRIFSLRYQHFYGREGEIQIASSALQRLGDVRYMNVDDSGGRIRIDGAEGCESLPTKLVLLKCDNPHLTRILLHSTLRKGLVGLKLENLDDLEVPEDRLRFRYSKLRFQRHDNTNSGFAGCMFWSTMHTKLTATAPVERVLHEIGRFSHLEVLELRGGRCDSLPETFSQLKKLRHLVLKDFCLFRTLPHSFGNLSFLNRLEFSYCKELENLPESFGELRALNYLRFMSCEKLHTLPNSFGNLSSLNHLEFYLCKELENLPESFGELRALKYLKFMSCEKLHTLPNSFGNLSSLNHLEFYLYKELENLPESFGDLQALNYLKFMSCEKLHTLPNSFGNLSLNHLEFKNCKELENLPDSLGELQALNYLKFMSCEKLHTLPNSFGNLSSLNRLEFSYCKELENLPESFGELRALKYLQFWRCEKLRTLPNSFGNLSSLYHLEFKNCKELENLPESLGELRALNYLKFMSCEKLHTLPNSFGNLSSLNRLYFYECNKLGNLPESFGELRALNHLKFMFCKKLHTLPNSFGNLSSLNHLKFSECKGLENLPESFGELRALNYLEFFYCEKLHTLPNSFGNLSSLNHLEFYVCKELENLPESFGELRALNYLKFGCCKMLHTIPKGLSYLNFRKVKEGARGTIFIFSRFHLEED